MMIACPRPWVLWAALVVVPAVLMALLWCRRIARSGLAGSPSLFRIRTALSGRLVCWALAWLMLLLALSGLRWGTRLVPVQQTGSSLSIVFDISWSMTARDVGSGQTGDASRLEAAAGYTRILLERLEGTDVSVVVAKGEGVLAIPLTRDFNAIRSLLPALSPRLMTTTGTSLGSGLRAAASSFPLLSVSKRTVLVLTDGEETDGALRQEAESLVSAGIDVVFLGFGTVEGAAVLAGDGTTVVHSSLQEDALLALVDSVNGAAASSEMGRSGGAQACYLPAQSLGSAHKVLAVVAAGRQEGDWSGTTYQVEGRERWQIFTALAMGFLCLGFVFGELNPSGLKGILRLKSPGRSLTILLLPAAGFFFHGCSRDWQGAADVLEGSFFWHQGKYQEAVSRFMDGIAASEALADGTLLQYSTYGLAATYLMQGETGAALSRLQELAPDAPEGLRFAALYNTGIIAYNQGRYQEAASLFRQALEVDGGSLDAKINLELSLGQDAVQGKAASQELIPVQETPADDFADSALFSLIRQQEQERWQNQQDDRAAPSGDDY